jgi:DNA-binding CsgD family transcriptional regulator
MGISIKTVANHRANLMAKTGALNAADLVRMSMIAEIV